MKCFLKDRWNGVLKLTGKNGDGWSFPFPVVSGSQSLGQNKNGPWVPVVTTCVINDENHFHELYKKWGQGYEEVDT
jgi:hypothetical protein